MLEVALLGYFGGIVLSLVLVLWYMTDDGLPRRRYKRRYKTRK